jgi:cytochrome c-type biogenesis protein CcmH
MKPWLALLLLCLMASGGQALQTADAPSSSLANQQLADPAAEARATALMAQLRCIQCQGQSIHDSDAPIASAMRHEVRSRIAKGESDRQIRDWLIKRYGEWIDFSPSSHGIGLVLWALPLLLIGFALWLARSRLGKNA